MVSKYGDLYGGMLYTVHFLSLCVCDCTSFQYILECIFGLAMKHLGDCALYLGLYVMNVERKPLDKPGMQSYAHFPGNKSN